MNNIVWKLKRAERIIGARPFLLEYNIVDFVHGAAARMFAFLFAIPLSTFVTANRRLLQRDISRALWTRRVRRIVDDAVVADDCSLHTWWHDWFAARRLACWSHRQVNIIRISTRPGYNRPTGGYCFCARQTRICPWFCLSVGPSAKMDRRRLLITTEMWCV